MPLAVRERAGVHDRAAVGGYLDLAVLLLAQRVRDLGVRADPDPQLDHAALVSETLLLCPQLLVADRAQREVERPLVVPRVVRRTRRGLVREGVLGDEVLPPQLGGIHVDLRGEEVDHALDRLCRLRPPGTADRRHGSRVGDDREPFDLDARDCVHPAREQPGQVRQKGADTGVRTGVRKDVDPVGEQLAVAGPAELELETLAAAVRERDHALAPGLRPAYGLAEVTSKPDDQCLLRAERALGTEAAADVRSDHAQLTGLHAQRGREPEVVAVRHLRGEPRGHTAVRVDLGGRGAHLERASGHSLAHDRVGYDDVAPFEEVLIVVHAAGPARDVRPHLRVQNDLVLRRVDHVHDDGQRVVLDRDELGGVDARRPVGAHDDGDDVADEANDVLGDDRASHPLLEHRDRRRTRRDVDVVAREDLHVRQRLRSGRVDSDDAGVGEERADERDRERTLERQVLDVRGFATKETRVFLPEHAVPEDAHPSEPIVARSGVQQVGGSIRAFAFSRPSAAEHRPHGGSHVGTCG